jgi:nucleotide-binding universal stress UspA family protein
MKTFLVPTDFSKTATHAAYYAAELSKQGDVRRIILLNSYFFSVYESILPSPDFVYISEEEIQTNINERMGQLETLKKELGSLVRENVMIDTQLSRLPLNQSIIELIDSESVDVVILGSNGKGAKEDSQIGKNAISISKTCPVPVIVVPPTGDFETLKRVVLACDFKKVTKTMPLRSLKKILNDPSVELLVINVDPEGRHNNWDPEIIAEQTDLHQMLKCFNPKYYFSSHLDTISGIIDFATRRDAQLIIALPKKYSFFESLLHSSITQKLTINSSLPVLLLKEEEEEELI